MLDGHPELAIANESFFLPALWTRHGGRVRTRRFADDLRLIELSRPDSSWSEADLTELGRLGEEAGFAEAVDAFYRAHSVARGARRYGNKSPEYMHHLELMERAFPGVQYVHIVRDGRSAALSWSSMTESRSRLRWPTGLRGYACEWSDVVAAARRLGSAVGPGRYAEVRYEDLVSRPEAELRRLCEFLGLRFEPAMLEYWRRIPAERALPNHPRLMEPPGPDARDWRRALPPAALERLEAVAGDVLSALGYERVYPAPGTRARAAAAGAMALSRLRRATWRAAAWLWRKSPFWRFRPL
jgi:hypothetical protein